MCVYIKLLINQFASIHPSTLPSLTGTSHTLIFSRRYYDREHNNHGYHRHYRTLDISQNFINKLFTPNFTTNKSMLFIWFARNINSL